MINRGGRAAAFALVVAGAAIASPASAQKAFESVPVTVALVDELPPLERQYEALVVRSVTGTDLVLLAAPNVEAVVLDEAVRVLMFSRASTGVPANRFGPRAVRNDLVIGIAPRQRRPDQSRRVRLQDAEEIIGRLLQATPTPVSDIGVVPSVTFSPKLVRNDGL